MNTRIARVVELERGVWTRRARAVCDGADRVSAVGVQINCSTKGKLRPPYRAEEEDEDDEDYDVEPVDALLGDGDEATAELEIGWVDLLAWLPHEELEGGDWKEVKGEARDDEVEYFRGQLKLFAQLVYGRNQTAAGTIVELVPLEALLTLLETKASRRLLPRDLHLVSDLLLWLYIDSCTLRP